MIRKFLIKVGILNRYNPYCKYCSSCGETGCCSASICINHKRGKYCQINQAELKQYYVILKQLWDWAYETNNQPLLNKLNELYDEQDK
jgi:hypothetical protein